MTNAPLCPQTGQPMTRGVRPFVIRYKGFSETIEMPGWYCDASSESVHTKEDMKVSDLALVTLKAGVQNLATPEEIRRIRTGLGLTQGEAGLLIGGGVRAFQKYESGEVLASQAITTALRLLSRHPDELGRLREDAARAEEREYA